MRVSPFVAAAALASCGSSSRDPPVEPEPEPAPRLALEIRPPLFLARTWGTAEVAHFKAAFAGETMLAVVEDVPESRIVGHRSTSAGIPIDEAAFVVASEGTPLAVTGSPDGGWVVTWRESQGPLQHTFVSADGGVEATVPGGTMGVDDTLVVTKATEGGVRAWTAECDRQAGVPAFRCSLVRRETGRDGAVEPPLAVVPGFGTEDTRFAGVLRPEDGAFAWTAHRNDPEQPLVVEATFVDADGLAVVPTVTLGSYGAPVAIAMRDDGAALVTVDEIVWLSSDGAVEAERRDGNGIAIVAVPAGYQTLFFSRDALVVDDYSTTGERTTGCRVAFDGILAADTAPAIVEGRDFVRAAWVDESVDGTVLRSVETEGSCSAVERTWELLPNVLFPGGATAAWGSTSGLAVVFGERAPDPSDPLVLEGGPPAVDMRVFAFDLEATPAGGFTTISTIAPGLLTATTDGFWLRDRLGVVVLGPGGTEIDRREIADRDAATLWVGEHGWIVDAVRDPEDWSVELRAVDSSLQPLPDRELLEVSTEREPDQVVAADDGVLLVDHGLGVTVFDPDTLEPHFDADVAGGLWGRVVSCGPSCWLTVAGARSERVELVGSTLVRTPLDLPDGARVAFAGRHLLAVIVDGSLVQLRLYERSGEALLAEAELTIAAADSVVPSAVSETRFVITYEDDEPDVPTGRATFLRVIDVVPAAGRDPATGPVPPGP